MPQPLIAALKQRILDLGGQSKGYSQTSVVSALIEDWLGGRRSIEIVPPAVGSKALQDDLARLTAILEHGSPSQRESIRGVIKTVSEAVEVSQNPSRSRTTPKPKKKAG